MKNEDKISKMLKSPKISVIVPAYNIEHYLSACLDSILRQTYENIEIILIDDGSTDRTGEIADQYEQNHSNTIFCIHQKNCGVAKARLNGIEAASGEWIGFVDGDDVIERDMYERLLENALDYQADISHCGYQTIVNNGERIHYFYNTGRVVLQDRETGLRDLLEGAFVEPGLWNKLFHKSLFQNIWCYRDQLELFRINEDLLLNYYLFKEAHSAVYEDFCPYHYMAISTSATRSAFQSYKVLDPIEVNKIILDDIDSQLKEYSWRRYLISCIHGYAALYGMDGFEEKVKELRDILSKNRKKCHLLEKKQRKRRIFLLLLPGLYQRIYKIYERHLQEKVYE